MITKNEKLKELQTSVGIHTLNGTTDDLIDLKKAKKHNTVTESYYRNMDGEDILETYIRINPNPKSGHVLAEYSTFKRVMDDIFNDLNVKGFKCNRADLSFNSSDPEFFTKYMKLFRLLIACISCDSNDKNTTDSKGFWNDTTKSLYTKNQLREIEYYDRYEKDKNSPYSARLELRSRRVKNSIEHEFLCVWFQRLDRAVKQFEKVQNKYNQDFAEEFINDMAKEKCYRKHLSLTSFLMVKSECIFTRKQMLNLLIELGYSKERAKNKVYNFKKEHKIEFFSIKDLEFLIDYIKNEIKNYFEK